MRLPLNLLLLSCLLLSSTAQTFVSWRYNVSFCSCPKAASTAISVFVANIEESGAVRGKPIEPQQHCGITIDRHELKGSEVYDRCASRLRYVRIIRDPLERLLSGFLDKCALFLTHGNLDICSEKINEDLPVELQHHFKEIPQFSTFVDILYHMERANPGHMRNTINPHFRLQSSQCPGYPVEFSETIVFSQTDSEGFSNMGNSMRSICQQYNLPMDTCELSFPDTTTSHHASNSGAKLQDYYDSKTLTQALFLLIPDYVSLEIPIPAWVADVPSRSGNNGSTIVTEIRHEVVVQKVEVKSGDHTTWSLNTMLLVAAVAALVGGLVQKYGGRSEYRAVPITASDNHDSRL